jgi:hypothetical protein
LNDEWLAATIPTKPPTTIKAGPCFLRTNEGNVAGVMKI